MKAAENPFRSSEIAKIRYAIPADELARLAARALEEPFRTCCIAGPEGSGKTTLLEDLAPVLQKTSPTIHRITLNMDSRASEKRRAVRFITNLGREEICLLDGGEVLPWTAWFSLRHRSRTRQFRLIATLHRPRGLPVLLRTQVEWITTRRLVTSLANRHMSPSLEAVAYRAHQDSSGNAREVFRACYMALMNGPTSRSS